MEDRDLTKEKVGLDNNAQPVSGWARYRLCVVCGEIMSTKNKKLHYVGPDQFVHKKCYDNVVAHYKREMIKEAKRKGQIESPVEVKDGDNNQ